MARYHYRAFCGKCDYTVKESTSNDFMSRFFLGSRCNNCGDYKSDRLFDDDCWKVEFGEWVREVPFNFFDFSTWRKGYSWQEKEDE